MYILDEVGGIGLLNSDFVGLYKRKPSIPDRELIVCDSAEPKSISELVREYSLNCIGMFKAKGSVESTTKYLQDLTEIVIDKERTPQTYHNFMNAEFETDRNGNVLQRLRHPNDFVDSCRYRISIEMISKGGWNTKITHKPTPHTLQRKRTYL